MPNTTGWNGNHRDAAENVLMESATGIDAARPHLMTLAARGDPHAYAALELSVAAKALMARACRALNAGTTSAA